MNPFPLVEPEALQFSPDDGINLETPAGDSIFSGLGTFAHLPYGACLSAITSQLPEGSEEVAPGDTFDIAVLGMPFDTAVSFRPGARFGPSGIRHNSRRMSKFRGYNVPLGVNVYTSGQKILDCGDVPVTVRSGVYVRVSECSYEQRSHNRHSTITLPSNKCIKGMPHSWTERHRRPR